MKRKTIALETVEILRRGYYDVAGQTVDFAVAQKYSEDNSLLITPEQRAALIRQSREQAGAERVKLTVVNQATVKAVLAYQEAGSAQIGVLNFASAKNPGGGFLGGAMAQEESLAAASGLYGTLLRHETYYRANRACGTMIYTDHAIYSPDVVFFRDERSALLAQPVTASVLTLPAVNMGQVLLKGEDVQEAQVRMLERMRLALAIFAAKGDKNLVLGAYGCGVFRNDPADIAAGWRRLLTEEGYGRLFTEIVFAVLDTAKAQKCIKAFEAEFGAGR